MTMQAEQQAQAERQAQEQAAQEAREAEQAAAEDARQVEEAAAREAAEVEAAAEREAAEVEQQVETEDAAVNEAVAREEAEAVHELAATQPKSRLASALDEVRAQNRTERAAKARAAELERQEQGIASDDERYAAGALAPTLRRPDPVERPRPQRVRSNDGPRERSNFF